MLSITTAHLTDGSASGGTGSTTTASISPTPQRYYTIFVRGRANSGAPNTPTVVGCGITWTMTKAVVQNTSSGAWYFRGLGTPTTGTLVIDFQGQSISTIAWCVDEWATVSRAGVNGSDGSVQTASNTSGNSASFSVTAATLASPNNVLLGYLAQTSSISTLTAGSGQNVIVNHGFDGDDSWLVQWKLNTTTSDISSNTGSSGWEGIAVELKFSPSSGILGGDI